jgi:(1->4)-alpha-D-glucan 1-alpha-D-glucosylmutase
VRRWRELNQDKKSMVADAEAPSRNDEYLLYQTLIGSWPLEKPAADPSFHERITQYMLKAVREAKEKTSWANPNTAYEEAVTKFVEAILACDGADQFLADFVPFQRHIARMGMFNSLSQTLIKLTSPGVPDIYQGNELWDFSLVDPDNRRPVDYSRHQHLLQEFEPLSKRPCEHLKGNVRELTEHMSDGRIKMYLTWRTLSLRKQCPALFQKGNYLPLSVQGEKANHLIAFARQGGNSVVIVAVPRFCAQLLADGATSPLDPTVWKDTRLELPFGSHIPLYQNLFTLENVVPEKSDQTSFVQASKLFANFPVALLTLESPKLHEP